MKESNKQLIKTKTEEETSKIVKEPVISVWIIEINCQTKTIKNITAKKAL